MQPSPASISAAWNEWQAMGGNSAIEQNQVTSMEAMGRIVRAAFDRMAKDGHMMIRAMEEDPPRLITERFLESVPFQGQTRTLGEAQGYRPLHIADLMIPMGDGDHIQPMMASIHAINRNDLALLAKGHGIQLTLYGSDHPPMALQITPEPILLSDGSE